MDESIDESAASPHGVHGAGAELSGTAGRHLGRARLQVPHWRSAAGVEAALPHARREDWRAGDHHAWHHRLGSRFSHTYLRRGVVWGGAAAGCEALLHHPAGRGGTWPLEQAVRRAEDEISALQL